MLVAVGSGVFVARGVLVGVDEAAAVGVAVGVAVKVLVGVLVAALAVAVAFTVAVTSGVGEGVGVLYVQSSVLWHLEHCPRGWPLGRE